MPSNGIRWRGSSPDEAARAVARAASSGGDRQLPPAAHEGAESEEAGYQHRAGREGSGAAARVETSTVRKLALVTSLSVKRPEQVQTSVDRAEQAPPDCVKLPTMEWVASSFKSSEFVTVPALPWTETLSLSVVLPTAKSGFPFTTGIVPNLLASTGASMHETERF